MKRLIKWLKSGGNRLIGIDENGDKMYSVSNGMSPLMWVVPVIVVAILFCAAFLF